MSAAYDVLIISINLNGITILNINGADYCYIINGIIKKDALNLLKNSELTEKRSIIKITKSPGTAGVCFFCRNRQ